MDYVITARAIKKNAFIAEPGPVRYLRVPPDQPIPLPVHAATNRLDRERWIKEVRTLADNNPNTRSISPQGDVLVFIHGYNNDLNVIMKRQRQLAKDLRAEGWNGLVIGFDWPSNDSTLNYLEDRRDASKVAIELVRGGIKLIANGQEGGCGTNLHLLGHSTGAFVIMEALVQAEKDGELFKSDWRIGQVAFIGGDVAASSLSVTSQWSNPMFSRIMRLTNYANPFDSVLGISNAKRLGVAPRAGRVGLPLDAHPKSVNVHCGDYFNTINPKNAVFFGTFNHSWHIGDRVFARDLAMTLEGAIDRLAIPTRLWGNGLLSLRDANRPAFIDDWQLERGIV